MSPEGIQTEEQRLAFQDPMREGFEGVVERATARLVGLRQFAGVAGKAGVFEQLKQRAPALAAL